MNIPNNGKVESDIQLMLIGDQAVGKSSLMVRYTEDNFFTNMLGTAGIDFKKKIIIKDEKKIKVTVFDTAGHERFLKINKSYYRTAKGIILVYDITDRQTFEHVTVWMNSILENTDKKPLQILIIGNKFDMETERVVSKEEGENIAKKYNTLFTETSAKTGENVENAYSMIIDGCILKEKNLVEKNQAVKEKDNIVDSSEKVKSTIILKPTTTYQECKTETDNNKILLSQNAESEKLSSNTEGNLQNKDKKKNNKCFCV